MFAGHAIVKLSTANTVLCHAVPSLGSDLINNTRDHPQCHLAARHRVSVFTDSGRRRLPNPPADPPGLTPANSIVSYCLTAAAFREPAHNKTH